jgi:lipopolysaccharide/colanic/teichoic acid biosynthesis glycosyltransferase
VELNFVPEMLHGIGSSMKQKEISNDNTRKTDNVAKTTVIVVVRIIVIILRLIVVVVIIIIIIIVIVNYKMSSLIPLP